MSNNRFGALPFDWPILINTAELHFYFNAQDKWPNMVLFGLLSRDGNLGYLSFSPVPSRRVLWVRQCRGPEGLDGFATPSCSADSRLPRGCCQSNSDPINLAQLWHSETSVPVRGYKERFTQVKNKMVLSSILERFKMSQLFLEKKNTARIANAVTITLYSIQFTM